MARQEHHGRRWRTVRARVLRASTVCWLCGEDGADSVDHVVPVSLGGPVFDPVNLRPAHLDCNRRRGNRDADVYRAVPPSRAW